MTSAFRRLALAILAPGLAVLALMPFVFAVTSPAQAGEPYLPKIMPNDLEMELALSAAPKEIRDAATVYILRRGGYVLAREGTNHYTCFVGRSIWRPGLQSPRAIIPICTDEDGTRTLLPVHFDNAKYREQGLQAGEIGKRIEEGFANGKYTAPKRTGIAYMVSPILKVPDGKGGTITYVPHFMFYAPGLTNEELDTVRDTGGGWLPWILNSGGPRGVIIVPVGEKERERIYNDTEELVRRVDAFLQSE